MTNVDYRFTSTEEGNLVFRSTVHSFGLDSVTDKDISSFYNSFSKYAHIDTGLLPVNNTGLLSIRSAGNHMQVAYQYEPGMYRINWGSFEGDSSAKAYYVAQPYRIVVGDFLDGNFYGARMFYSLQPVTHPDVQLYHVNLPNINCKGYRGNGVGWTCLYRNHDITSYPFNEKLLYLLERCSGVEAYNDANMNETDGPRFYADHYSNNPEYSHLWNPSDWESYSSANGIDWTLDENLWIPIKVKSIDDQGSHFKDGIDFTFFVALLGNYAAYYNDTYLPKPINALVRDDLSIDSSKVFDWFKISYNSSSTTLTKVDTLKASTQLKAEHVDSPTIAAFDSDSEEEPDWVCASCSEGYSNNDEYLSVNDEMICMNCDSEVIWCQIEEQYIWNHQAIICSSTGEAYPDYSSDYTQINCVNCSSVHVLINDNISNKSSLNLYTLKQLDPTTHVETLYLCSACVDEIDDDYLKSYYGKEVAKCYHCNQSVPVESDIDYNDPFNSSYENICLHPAIVDSQIDGSLPSYLVPLCNFHYSFADPFHKKNINYIPSLDKDNMALCICGKMSPISSFADSHNPDMPWSKTWIYSSDIDFKSFLPNFVSNYTLDHSAFIDSDDYNVTFRVLLLKNCSHCSEVSYYKMDSSQRLNSFNSLIDKLSSEQVIFTYPIYGLKATIEIISHN